MTHFLDIADHRADWLSHVLEVSHDLLADRRAGPPDEPVLTGRTLAMVFEKPSLRTRVSFEQAMIELGGSAIVLQQHEVGLGQRESVADVARVLGGMVDGIMARVFEHAKLQEMAAHSPVPVINALSDASHPCQALADVMTIQQAFGRDLSDRTVVFVGDGNNVAASLAQLCARLGIRFVLSSPPAHQMDLRTVVTDPDEARLINWVQDPAEAVAQADVIYADTFVSMGQEEQKAARLAEFAEYQVNEALVARAPQHAVVLHCLPAYRDVEITEAVIDSPQSRIFPQAHNRLHAQKGLLAVLLAGR